MREPRNRVVQVRHFGGPDGLEVVDGPLPTAGRGEVRVRVLASSVQYTDVLIRRHLYPQSFNRPGGNMTGVAFLVNKLVAKRLELLCDTVPKESMIGMLLDPNNPNAKSDVQLTQAAANALGRTLVIANVATENDLDAAFANLMEHRIGALFVAPNANFRIWRDRLLALVARHGIPSSYSNGDFVRAGGLMSYGPDQADAYRQAGSYAGRVLKGEKPADLPVLQPTKFDFVLNLKAANTLGLTLPPTMLALASEIIE